MRIQSFNPPGMVDGELLTSGYVGIVDGPWACYVCAVFGDTAEGWLRHGEEKHPVKIVYMNETIPLPQTRNAMMAITTTARMS